MNKKLFILPLLFVIGVLVATAVKADGCYFDELFAGTVCHATMDTEVSRAVCIELETMDPTESYNLAGSECYFFADEYTGWGASGYWEQCFGQDECGLMYAWAVQRE